MLALLALVVFGVFMAVGSAGAATPKALINGDTVVGGAGSQEAQIASAQGFAVTVVSGASWNALTQADYGQYDVIILGDPSCGSFAASASATATTWGPVVMGHAGGRTAAGNRVLVGTDPVYHDGGPFTARAAVIRDGIAFAGKQVGRTGLYMTASCAGGPPQLLATLNQISAGAGAWTINGSPPCGGSASIIASNPSFASTTSASLQGWGCSVHETFPTFPTDWNPLAVATDTASRPTCGMSPPGFDGGFDARVSLVEGEARSHGESEEVSGGVVGARHAVGVRVGTSDHACRC